MLRGVWLVTLDWAADCLREGRLLPHHPYEVQVWLSPARLSLVTPGANVILQGPHEHQVFQAPLLPDARCGHVRSQAHAIRIFSVASGLLTISWRT